jgi:hypothetical protein
MVHNTIICQPIAGTLQKDHGLRRVVVFGAGVSKGLGVPLGKELLEAVVTWSEDSGNAGYSAHLLRFLEEFYPRFDRHSGNLPLVEDVLGMLDTAEHYNDIRSRSRGYKWRSGEISLIRDHFLKLIDLYLWSFQDTFLRLGKENYLRTFVRTCGDKTVYVTFNYDLSLETALSLEEIPYSYGLPIPQEGVTVLKPHGSINWFLRTRAFPKPDSFNWFNLGGQIVCPKTLHYSQLRFGKPRQPLIVPPSPMKQIIHFELKKSWTAFSSTVHSTPVILIVGYSMSEADRLSRLILRRAGRPPGTYRRIVVVNQSDDLEDLYRSVISLKCEFIPKKFEDWITDGGVPFSPP